MENVETNGSIPFSFLHFLRKLRESFFFLMAGNGFATCCFVIKIQF